MKIVKKFADIKPRDKRDTKDINYIVIQAFSDQDTSHYHVSDGKIVQILPDNCISNSINGGKVSRFGLYHGICNKYNSVSICI